MQQLDFSWIQTQTFNHWPLFKLFGAVPQPAEDLGENGGNHQEQHQDDETHVGLLLVESNHCPYIQHNVQQQEAKTHESEHKVQTGVFEHSHCVHSFWSSLAHGTSRLSWGGSTNGSRGFERQAKLEEEAKFSSSYSPQPHSLKANGHNRSVGKLSR